MYTVVENICHVDTALTVLNNSMRKFSLCDLLLLMIFCPVIIIGWRPWNLLVLLLLNILKSMSIYSTRLLVTVTCLILL